MVPAPYLTEVEPERKASRLDNSKESLSTKNILK